MSLKEDFQRAIAASQQGKAVAGSDTITNRSVALLNLEDPENYEEIDAVRNAIKGRKLSSTVHKKTTEFTVDSVRWTADGLWHIYGDAANLWAYIDSYIGELTPKQFRELLTGKTIKIKGLTTLKLL